MLAEKRQNKLAFVAAFLIPLFLVLGIVLGSVSFSAQEIVQCIFDNCDDTTADILWKIRLPRTIGALIGGAGLAVSGLLLQSLFRNPLAGPGILGITSGASFGVAVLVMGGVSAGVGIALIGVESIFVAALGGSFLTTLLLLSLVRFLANSTTLLLVGLMINWIIGSAIAVLGILAQQQNLQLFYVWTLGSFAPTTIHSIYFMVSIIIPAIAVSIFYYKKLDASLLGDDYAKSIGVNIKSLQKFSIVVSSVLVAAVTSVAGPIGFIGIAGPYLARLTSKSGSHRMIIPLAIVYGSLLTVIADIAARLILKPIDLPITIITALIGGPIVIFMLVKKRGEGLSQ